MSNSILLTGLDGSNPLAFLAALGTLRTLTQALSDESVKMSWEQADGGWRPRVFCSLDKNKLVDRLDKNFVRDRQAHPTRFIDYESSNAQAGKFYQAVREGDKTEPEQDAWIASLTNDVHPDATSPLQLTRSDYFIGNLDMVMKNTDFKHIQKTLFDSWRYDDILSGQSLHLEPTEDRRHAYQWNKPSGDPNRNKSGNMLGANRLAIEAIPLFLGLPSSNPARLLMTGWTGVRASNATWTWPIWSSCSNMDVIKSVLSLAELKETAPSRDQLKPMGIETVYRCRRILVEKTPNLTPSLCVM